MATKFILPRIASLIVGLLQCCLTFPLHAQSFVTLPNWSELVLELSPALVVKVQVEPGSGSQAMPNLLEYPDALQPTPDEALYHLTVETRLKWFLSSKSWLGDLWFKPDLTALQRTRLKSGRSRNYKIYRYAGKRVYRVRRQPTDQDSGTDPQSWPVKNKRIYPFSPQVASLCQKISDPYILLLLLSQGSFDQEEKICIFNKNTVYQVILRREGRQDLKVDYRLGADPVRTRIKAERIAVLPRPIQTDSGLPIEPFELLGMEGDIVTLVDPDHHIPLQFEGKVPGFGQAKLRLTQVRPRQPRSPN